MPANAGIQAAAEKLDTRFRGHDEQLANSVCDPHGHPIWQGSDRGDPELLAAHVLLQISPI